MPMYFATKEAYKKRIFNPDDHRIVQIRKLKHKANTAASISLQTKEKG